MTRGIVENWDDWKISLKKGECVTTYSESVDKGTGVNKTVTTWVSEQAEDRDIDIQHKTVYDALEDLGERAEFEYEETRKGGKKRRFLWKVEK